MKRKDILETIYIYEELKARKDAYALSCRSGFICADIDTNHYLYPLLKKTEEQIERFLDEEIK